MRFISLAMLLALLSSPLRAAETATFKYDGLGRLTQSFKQGSGADGALTTITHDPADNRAAYASGNVTRALLPGGKLYSADNRFYLTLQANGQLAVIMVAGTATLWASGTASQTADRAAFQSDGNFTIYSPSNTILWSTSTGGHPASQLKLQNDGNLIIVDQANIQTWQSNTGGH